MASSTLITIHRETDAPCRGRAFVTADKCNEDGRANKILYKTIMCAIIAGSLQHLPFQKPAHSISATVHHRPDKATEVR